MSSDAESQSKPNKIDEVDEVTLMWRWLTEGYKFEDGLSHETLTEQFDITNEDVAKDVCSEAFSYVMDDGRTRFEREDFEQAVEAVRSEPESDDQESGEDAVDEGHEKEYRGRDRLRTDHDQCRRCWYCRAGQFRRREGRR